MSAEWTAALLSSGEFSDFTIECDGQLFKVHKSIVCSQSPVIKAALSGDFEEAKNNHIKVDGFCVEAVQTMLNFMYGVPDKSLAEVDQKSLNAAPKRARTEGPESATGHQSTQTSGEEASADLEKLRKEAIALVWTNAIADYYQVPKLCNLANRNLNRIFQKRWSPTVFLEVVALVSTATGDLELHYILTRTAVEHIDELVKNKNNILPLTGLREFATVFMVCSAQHVDSLKGNLESYTEAAETRGELLVEVEALLSSAQKENEHNITKVETCLEAMERYATCRHCKQALKCYFDEGSTSVLRCRKCHTRH